MLLVVMGHVQLFVLPGTNKTIMSIIGASEMPIFFFISGFFGYKALDRWGKIKIHRQIYHKFRELIIPAAFFLFAFWFCFEITPEYIPLEKFLDGGFLGGYWFTPVLFEYFIVYFAIVYT